MSDTRPWPYGCQHAEDTAPPDRGAHYHDDGGIPGILAAIRICDAWLDDAAPAVYRQDPAASSELNEARAVANMWRRIAGGPVSEAAEACDAVIGVTGGNPRKGFYKTREEMLAEAGDTAVAALLFIQSQVKDTAETWQVFLAALAKAESRVPVPATLPPVEITGRQAEEILADPQRMAVLGLRERHVPAESQHMHDDDGTVEGCPGCFTRFPPGSGMDDQMARDNGLIEWDPDNTIIE